MSNTLRAAMLLAASLAAASGSARAAEAHAPDQGLALSPGLMHLLRAEMREIAAGVQGMALSLATADWAGIQATSEKIRASYLMEKSLTEAQATELRQKLPERFGQLDAAFHRRAEQLGSAAAARDAELAAFHYSRLIESCAVCHSAYAAARFPGFAAPVRQEHRH